MSSFFSPQIDRQSFVRVTRLRDQAHLADRCDVAVSFLARLKGLMFRSGLASGEGILFPNCRSIHMWGMRFSIDVIFLAREIRDGTEEIRVSSVFESVTPWKLLPVSDLAADDALEITSGTARRLNLQKGDVLCIS